ncbi:MAG: 2-oxoglutarate dehydrogenase E1 component [Alphaproteobacteria bacterium]|nr:2-oxoglutarate dehydrogenase E1 component [Alphaproteobacteria bacterium]
MSQNLSFLTGVNGEYIAHLYAQYLRQPHQVDSSWQQFFASLQDNELSVLRELHGASWTPSENRTEKNGFTYPVMTAPSSGASQSAPVSGDARQASRDSIGALMLIRAFRARGHLEADLDPLKLKEKKSHPELDPSHYGFSPDDYDRPIYIGGVLGMETGTMREIISALRTIYCGTIGVEFLHLTDPEEKSWIQQRIEEPRNKTDFTREGKIAIYQRLVAAESLEKFLHTKYVGTKRFGLDGGEAMIPCIEQIMKRGSQMGLKEVVVGMAHRGRLNILTNVMGKPFTALFAEFQGVPSVPDDVQGSGDVKYHMGTSGDREFDGQTIHLSLTANPSHLEFVNPVVVGKVRAKQAQREDQDRIAVMPILIHGDAAFAGQGVVAETLMMSELPGYRVGGTMHIIVNNQIGFTTTPKYSRSGPYCTDMAKMLAAPIFHVNGDDPESVVHVARIATEFRQKFKKDVVIDMFCYRRNGHNEGDEPAFTQPLMYKRIKDQETTCSQYGKKLIAENVMTEAEVKATVDDFMAFLENAFEATKSYRPNKADYLEGAWTGFKTAPDDDRRGVTSVKETDLRAVGKVLTDIPAGFSINPKIERLIETKKKMFETGEGFDWGTGEALAFGTLLQQGFGVRLSGQDVGRGTFSHRHAIVYDQVNENKHIALKALAQKDKGMHFEVHDSPLSELAVMGFEYGFTLADPKTLVCWEGQFGDFVNGAQVMIDQFISSGETKWLRMSGLVLLLPHGYEGQGPEHSSARPERFLQLCAEDNWQVANCTTPANYFHILRRQMCRDFRKPLVIMTPKSLLRHKLAVSDLADFSEGTSFHRILWDTDRDTLAPGKNIKRVVLCTGKVYYDLLQARRDRNLKDVMIVRVEQLYPFPALSLAQELKEYPNAEVVWCQEEPQNMGYWTFVEPRIEKVLTDIKHKSSRARYIGRVEAASPATGYLKRHNEEQAKLVDEALKV